MSKAQWSKWFRCGGLTCYTKVYWSGDWDVIWCLCVVNDEWVAHCIWGYRSTVNKGVKAWHCNPSQVCSKEWSHVKAFISRFRSMASHPILHVSLGCDKLGGSSVDCCCFSSLCWLIQCSMSVVGLINQAHHTFPVKLLGSTYLCIQCSG